MKKTIKQIKEDGWREFYKKSRKSMMMLHGSQIDQDQSEEELWRDGVRFCEDYPILKDKLFFWEELEKINNEYVRIRPHYMKPQITKCD